MVNLFLFHRDLRIVDNTTLIEQIKKEKSNISYHVGKIYSINTHSKFQVVMDGHMKTKRFSHIKYGYLVG